MCQPFCARWTAGERCTTPRVSPSIRPAGLKANKYATLLGMAYVDRLFMRLTARSALATKNSAWHPKSGAIVAAIPSSFFWPQNFLVLAPQAIRPLQTPIRTAGFPETKPPHPREPTHSREPQASGFFASREHVSSTRRPPYGFARHRSRKTAP